MKKLVGFLKQSLIFENAPLVCLLGLAPLLGASSALLPGLFCGICVLLVLVLSGVVISLVGRLIPSGVKEISYMVIIAFFTGLCELLLSAFLPEVYTSIGIYLPLVTVSGIAFSRAERADGESVKNAALAGLGSGLSFLAAAVVISFVRELLGSGTLFGFRIIPEEYAIRALSSPFGAFVLLGLLAAAVRYASARVAKKEGEGEEI